MTTKPFSPVKRNQEINLILAEWDEALIDNENIVQELKEAMRRSESGHNTLES